MTVRIGDAAATGRRRDRDEDVEPEVLSSRRRTAASGSPRRQRHGWWYHLEFALLKSRA
ncbi:hypothetical protein LWP59_36920 [Amycolatopsis acidiphila]|uniref:hypothetical protein n=1 Tax=Amycolatopsis acidiphila TaxID=715473 RepID=UPI001643D542|nr:hypothetical protein [Amycolatopsis acidiphila]UIJ59549.1 hypothetical protein LWP59_36920 [Amycolatopsis acidiphila]